MDRRQRIEMAVAEVRRHRAEREAAGLPDDRPCPFDMYEAERAAAQMSATITRYIETEFGTFENFETELDRELAGQVGRTAGEMIEYMHRYCAEED